MNYILLAVQICRGWQQCPWLKPTANLMCSTNPSSLRGQKINMRFLKLNITAYWSTIGSIYFSIKIVSPVRIFGNLGCFSTLITVSTCKVISVHMSFEHCKGLVPGLYVDILKVFCTAGSQCNSLFLTTADCCSKEKVYPPSLPIFILNSLITI